MQKKLTEAEIQNLEERFPYVAETATKQAYFNALSSGSSVLVVKNDELVEVFPDGREKMIKKVDPAIPVKKGTRLEIL